MKSRGFTLVEILIVIALIGILLAIAIPNYNERMTKAKIEKQTVELHSLIMSVRLSAMQNRRPGAIFLGPKQSIYRVYTSLDYTTLYSAAATGFRTVNTTSFPFVIQKITTGTPPADLDASIDKIIFDTRGFTDNDMTLVITPMKFNGGDNCIVVHKALTNIGRMENVSTCSTR